MTRAEPLAAASERLSEAIILLIAAGEDLPARPRHRCLHQTTLHRDIPRAPQQGALNLRLGSAENRYL